MICQEVAVNGQFLPRNSKQFKLPEKSKFLEHLPGKIDIFLCNCLNKLKFFGNLLEKSKYFLPGSTTPQISNQIDAAGRPKHFAVVDCISCDLKKFIRIVIVGLRPETNLN